MHGWFGLSSKDNLDAMHSASCDKVIEDNNVLLLLHFSLLFSRYFVSPEVSLLLINILTSCHSILFKNKKSQTLFEELVFAELEVGDSF